MFLGLAAVSFFANFSISVPRLLKEKIEDAAEGDGFEIEAQSMRLRLNGGVDFDGLEVFFKGSGKPIFTADKACVDFKIFTMIFTGRFEPRKLSLQNAAARRGFGADSDASVLENIRLKISESGEFYAVSCQGAKFENLGANLRGRVHKKFLRENLGGGSGKDPIRAWDKFCASLSSAKAIVRRFDAPFADADFEIGPGGNLRARLAARSAGCAFALGGGEIKTSALLAECFAEKNSGAFRADFFLKALNVSYGENISAGDLCLLGKADIEKMKALSLAVSASNIDFYKAKIGYAQAEKDEIRFSEFVSGQPPRLDGARAFFKIGGGNFLVDLKGEPGDFSAEFGGNFQPGELMKCSLIPPAEELKWFKFSDSGASVFGGANVKISGGSLLELGVSAFLDTRCSTLFGVETQSLSGDLAYDFESGEFWANNAFAVSDEGWNISAQIYQNLKNFDYKFYFTGSLRPSAIDHFMEKWWPEIFGEFKFDKTFPHTDIAVHGTWGKPEIMYVYGDVWLENAFKGGVKFDSASLSLWINPSRISIYNLHAKNGPRELSGALNWAYFSGELDSYDENAIFVNSTLNREELIAMGGEKVRESLKILDFDSAPKIRLNLLMKNPRRSNGAGDVMNLDYHCAGNTRAGKFELQNLKFKSYINGDDIYLKDMDFGIAGGVGSGSLFVGKKDGRDYFDADLKIKGANQKKFSEILFSLAPEPEKPPQEPNKPGEPEGFENAEFGKLNASAKISGFMDSPETFKGGGNLSVDNPKLGTINLFGVVSRLTSALRLPVGSFELSKAESPFEIENSQIIFGDLKITGAAAKIIGKARYNFMADTVGAKLLFSPFSEVKTPVVSQIINVVNPITSLAEIEIKGGIDAPEISIDLSPLNVFKSDESIKEGFKVDLDSEKPQGENGVE